MVCRVSAEGPCRIAHAVRKEAGPRLDDSAALTPWSRSLGQARTYGEAAAFANKRGPASWARRRRAPTRHGPSGDRRYFFTSRTIVVPTGMVSQ